MKKIISLAILFGAIILLSGCIKQNATDSVPQSQPEQTESTVSEKFCQADSDCACGRRIETKECFFGNVKYIDPLLRPCPDFCTGIDGRFRTKCVNNECRQVKVGTKDATENE